MIHHHPHQQQQKNQYHDIIIINHIDSSNKINKRIIMSTIVENTISHNVTTSKQRIHENDFLFLILKYYWIFLQYESFNLELINTFCPWCCFVECRSKIAFQYVTNVFRNRKRFSRKYNEISKKTNLLDE